jgi:hypothetical protein
MSEVAWAAGLFEGEGCITRQSSETRGGRRAGRLTLRLGMTDRDVIDRFQTAVGVGMVYGPYTARTRPNQKPTYHWCVGDIEQIQGVLRSFWPWLGDRRRARAALAIAQYYESDQVKRRTT